MLILALLSSIEREMILEADENESDFITNNSKEYTGIRMSKIFRFMIYVTVQKPGGEGGVYLIQNK
jgi:hypothetical protein